MDLSIKTYRVQENDTLESVTQQFNLTSEELKRYHNIYCELNQNLNVIPYHLTTDKDNYPEFY